MSHSIHHGNYLAGTALVGTAIYIDQGCSIGSAIQTLGSVAGSALYTIGKGISLMSTNPFTTSAIALFALSQTVGTPVQYRDYSLYTIAIMPAFIGSIPTLTASPLIATTFVITLLGITTLEAFAQSRSNGQKHFWNYSFITIAQNKTEEIDTRH